MVVFLSITIGYQITSVSILYNSKILKLLHKQYNQLYNNDLNMLASYYKKTIFTGLFLVIILIFIKDSFCYSIFNLKIRLYNIYVPISFYIIIYFIKANLVFFKIFVIPRNE